MLALPQIHGKVIFLDIDGVSVTRNTLFCERWTKRGIMDPMCVMMLRQLVIRSEAMIVISSSWRKSDTMDNLISVSFKEAGFHDFDEYVIGHTPIRNDGHRGSEIKDWMSSVMMIVDKYVIIDDDSDMLEEQLPFFIKTSNETGFSV